MAALSLRRVRSRLKSGMHRRWHSAVKRRSPRRLRSTIARYRGAREYLHGPVSRRSRHALDWLNFFIADVQTGFGSFVAFYLADLGWPKAHVGLALTCGTLASVLGQIPGGALTDALPWKRGLAAAGIVMIRCRRAPAATTASTPPATR